MELLILSLMVLILFAILTVDTIQKRRNFMNKGN
jgi:hypothetical protein